MVSVVMVGVVEDKSIAHAHKLFAERLAQMTFGEYMAGRSEGNGSGVEEEYLVAATSVIEAMGCLLYTSPSPRDATLSRMPSSA